MSMMMKIPKYRSHKTVWALKIASVASDPEWGGDGCVEFVEDGYAPITVNADWMQRFRGGHDDWGYYVVYEDGYTSWSPTRAFEAGYTLI